jgi:CheY-like chemotaxis protein
MAGDVGRLRQILINLLGNAVKFTETGGVTLTVSTAGVRDGRHELNFCVRDTGPGISEEDQAGLFDAFVQIDGSSTRSHEGAGLGLAISASLAELMGGGITVQSSPGEGSTFDLTVQASSVEESGALPAEPEGAAQPPAPGVNGGDAPARSVLVVDDNHMNRRVSARLLESLGHLPDLASDGFEAIEALQRHRYDLVFMDVQMPGLNGLEATRRIRELWPPPYGPRIVGLTGDASEQARQDCLAAGMDDYLAKPVTLEHYAEVLAG